MVTQIELGDITVDVVLKDIKNVHLSVYPPTGRVRISAPSRMSLDTIRIFAISKLAWIKQQQKKLHEQERETPREYLDRESHYVWGDRYLLRVIEFDAPPSVELEHSALLLHVRPEADESKKHAIVQEWYRQQLKQAARPLIAKWEPLMGVQVARFFVQRMKTRWGSCNHHAGNIRLNTELATLSIDTAETEARMGFVAMRLEESTATKLLDLVDRYERIAQFQIPLCREKFEQLNEVCDELRREISGAQLPTVTFVGIE